MADGGWWRRAPVVWAARVALVLTLGVGATIFALAVTPRVSISAFGQTVQVGAVPPGPDLGLSGPGRADLFGEGAVDTVQHFDGPIRPLIVWRKFNRNDEASAFLQSSSTDGKREVRTGSQQVGQMLADGWRRYFERLIAVAVIAGAALYLLVVGAAALFARAGPHRDRRRLHLALLSASMATSLAVTGGFTALTVTSAVRQLGQVRSLSDLVGTAKLVPVPAPAGPRRTGVDVVVIGDSTAAGIGNSPLPKPSKDDTACQRSADAYAVALQSVAGVSTLNLACSSATIADGLLGPQRAGGRTVASQVGVLRSVVAPSAVIVSVGANDVGWADFLRYCYGLPRCDDEASDRLFLSRLDAFKVQYAQLLQQLADLPGRPEVVVTTYYDPFGTSFDCAELRDPAAGAASPPGYGFGPDPGQDNQKEKIERKIDPLRAELGRMNAVLEQGASAFGFTVARPIFDGHALCSGQPWVQGMGEPAPFHPRAAGELAIAAAVLPHVPA